MKSPVLLLALTLTSATSATASDLNVETHRVLRTANGIRVQVRYEKPVAIAMIIPVRHEWSQSVDCQTTDEGENIPVITVAYKVTGKFPARSATEWTYVYSSKDFSFGSVDLCDGDDFSRAVVNGQMMALPSRN